MHQGWLLSSPSSSPPSSSYVFSSPPSSSASSSWRSIPSSPPPTSPLSYASRPHVMEQHSSPGPYFAHMHARYDRGIGREHEKYRELEWEGYNGYNKGKRVERERERDANRPSLPSIRELFGDFKSLRQSPSYSSSSSRSISGDSFGPGTPNSELPPIRSPEPATYSKSIPEHVFLSDDEEESYFYAVKPDSPRVDITYSDDERDERYTYSFSPERRRSTTFETSSERGLWSSSPTQRYRFPQRNSEPAPTSCSPLLSLSTVAAQAPTLHSSTTRTASEPAPSLNTESVRPFSKVANDQEPHSYSPDTRLALSPLPPSSPPLSPISPLPSSPASRAVSIPHLLGDDDPDSVSIVPVSDDVEMELESGPDHSTELSDMASHDGISPPGDMINPPIKVETEIPEGDQASESLDVKEIDITEPVQFPHSPTPEPTPIEDVDNTCLQSRDPQSSVNSPSSDSQHEADVIMQDVADVTGKNADAVVELENNKEVSHLFDDDDDLVDGSGAVAEPSRVNCSTPVPTASSDVVPVTEARPTREVEKVKQVLKANTEVVNAHSSTPACTDVLATLKPVKKRPLPATPQQEHIKKKARLSNASDKPSTVSEKPKSGVQADTSFFTASYISSTSMSLKSSSSNGFRRKRPEPAPLQKKGRGPQASGKAVTKSSVKSGKEVEKKDEKSKAVKKRLEVEETTKRKDAVTSEKGKASKKADKDIGPSKRGASTSDKKGKSVRRVDEDDTDEEEENQCPTRKVTPQPRAKPSKAGRLTEPVRKARVPNSPSKAQLIGRAKPKSLRTVQSDSESDSDSDAEDIQRSSTRLSSPLTQASSSSESESGSDEEESEDSEEESSSEEEVEEVVAKGKQRSKGRITRTKPNPRSRQKAKAKAKTPPPPLPPLAPLEAELTGLIIETMAQSRASSHPVPALYRSIIQTRPGALKGLVGLLSEPDTDGERRSFGEKEWLLELLRVMELGMTRSGVFQKVNSSGKDATDRPLGAQWFYVPEYDEDQERATLIKSIMPRPAKRNETKKYKQYYWKPLGKTLRWDAVDGI
ncbi:hypothetical protein VNI00_003892 [Paramarasmius palmivorus]|uniref:Uncharacterized protein n=1 Tax=Paramarasmius palmivorus TaxID=297713 RepID=A0AAW0DQI4_9AGAR